MFSVQLNRFIHRVSNKEAFIALASKADCKLKRIRRSSNWLLSGSEDQLKSLVQVLDGKDVWIKLAIEQALPKKELSIEEYLYSYPNATLNQLMLETNCSIKEARLALGQFEGLD